MSTDEDLDALFNRTVEQHRRAWLSELAQWSHAGHEPEDLVLFIEDGGEPHVLPREMAAMVLLPLGGQVLQDLETRPEARHVWVVALYGEHLTSAQRSLVELAAEGQG